MRPATRVRAVENTEDFRTALIAGADIIMPDDFAAADMHQAVRSRPPLDVSMRFTG
jgi:nicotinate-nucleotide pyrophosphorylase